MFKGCGQIYLASNLARVMMVHMSANNQIQDVVPRTKRKFIQQSWQLVVTIVICLGLGYFFDYEKIGQLVIYVPLAHAAWLWGYYYRKYHAEFMHNFAIANNLAYQAEGQTAGRYGKLFIHPREGRLFNIVAGTILGLPAELFNYEYKSGTGKYSVTHSITGLQITFKGLVPQFSVIEKRETIDSILRPRPGQYAHDLEGDFFKYYKLYVTDNQEIEILEILTPEIMAFMIDKSKHFSFEFVENQLFIYQNHYIANSKDLTAFVTLARMLLERLQKRIGRLHDDMVAIRSVTDRYN